MKTQDEPCDLKHETNRVSKDVKDLVQATSFWFEWKGIIRRHLGLNKSGGPCVCIALGIENFEKRIWLGAVVGSVTSGQMGAGKRSLDFPNRCFLTMQLF